MNLFILSWIYLKRKKSKTCILGLVLLILGTILISLIGIRSSLKKEVIDKQEKTIYLASKDKGVWPEEAFEAVKNSKITDTIYGIREIEVSADVQYVSHKGIIKSNPSLTIVSYNDSENIKAFKEQLVLVKGRTLTNKDNNKILIHESFAKINRLKVGSSVDIKGNKLEVVGIFKASKQNESNSIENTFITNETSMAVFEKTSGYSTIVFTVKDVKVVDSVIKSIKQWKVDWSVLSVKKATEFYGEAYQNIVTIYYLINRIIILLSIFTTTILVVVLKRWINSRVRETGILLALGNSKIQIISRYLIEVGIVSTVSLGISVLFGLLLGKGLFSSIMNQVTGGVAASVIQESSIYVENFKDIDITIGTADIFLLYLIGSIICMMAVAISAYSIMRLKPREILTLMS